MFSVFRFAAVAAAAAALLPVGGSASTTGSGLYGSVRKGPVMPVCQQGVPCDAPAQIMLVFSRSTAFGDTMETKQVAIKSDKNGRYRIALAPGSTDWRRERASRTRWRMQAARRGTRISRG